MRTVRVLIICALAAAHAAAEPAEATLSHAEGRDVRLTGGAAEPVLTPDAGAARPLVLSRGATLRARLIAAEPDALLVRLPDARLVRVERASLARLELRTPGTRGRTARRGLWIGLGVGALTGAALLASCDEFCSDGIGVTVGTAVVGTFAVMGAAGGALVGVAAGRSEGWQDLPLASAAPALARPSATTPRGPRAAFTLRF
jgi:hypothetical protein